MALDIQHARRMRRIVLSSVACLNLPHFPTLSHERHHFGRKKVNEHKMCVLIFTTFLSETFFFLRRTEQDMIINVLGSPCKVPDILIRFNET